jgi:hypothetical protein
MKFGEGVEREKHTSGAKALEYFLLVVAGAKAPAYLKTSLVLAFKASAKTEAKA